MGHYLLTLLVTFEQEIAIQDFFKENGWPFMKTGPKEVDSKTNNSQKDCHLIDDLDANKITEPVGDDAIHEAAFTEIKTEQESDADDLKTGSDTDIDEKYTAAENDSLTGRKTTYVDEKYTAENDFNSENDTQVESEVPCEDAGLSQKFRCEICNHSFKYKKIYDKHVSANGCKRICEFCGKIFYRRQIGKYNMHMKVHNNQRDHTCQTCGKSYFERNYLLRHQRVMHKGERNYICDVCGKDFPTNSHVWTHRREVHGNHTYHCQYCEKVYRSKSGLETHLNLKHGKGELKQLPCSKCGKVFPKNYLLKSHMASHGTNDFQCDQCPSAFKSLARLKVHKKRHAKAYSYYCTQCNKGFYQPLKLKEHEMIHAGIKPHQCKICGFRCNDRGNLTKHMKKHLTPYM